STILQFQLWATRRRIAILKQHFDNLHQVLPQLVERFPLRMCTRETRNIADKQPGISTALDHGSRRWHGRLQVFIRDFDALAWRLRGSNLRPNRKSRKWP